MSAEPNGLWDLVERTKKPSTEQKGKYPLQLDEFIEDEADVPFASLVPPQPRGESRSGNTRPLRPVSEKTRPVHTVSDNTHAVTVEDKTQNFRTISQDNQDPSANLAQHEPPLIRQTDTQKQHLDRGVVSALPEGERVPTLVITPDQLAQLDRLVIELENTPIPDDEPTVPREPATRLQRVWDRVPPQVKDFIHSLTAFGERQFSRRNRRRNPQENNNPIQPETNRTIENFDASSEQQRQVDAINIQLRDATRELVSVQRDIDVNETATVSTGEDLRNAELDRDKARTIINTEIGPRVTLLFTALSDQEGSLGEEFYKYFDEKRIVDVQTNWDNAINYLEALLKKAAEQQEGFGRFGLLSNVNILGFKRLAGKALEARVTPLLEQVKLLKEQVTVYTEQDEKTKRLIDEKDRLARRGRILDRIANDARTHIISLTQQLDILTGRPAEASSSQVETGMFRGQPVEFYPVTPRREPTPAEMRIFQRLIQGALETSPRMRREGNHFILPGVEVSWGNGENEGGGHLSGIKDMFLSEDEKSLIIDTGSGYEAISPVELKYLRIR